MPKKGGKKKPASEKEEGNNVDKLNFGEEKEQPQPSSPDCSPKKIRQKLDGEDSDEIEEISFAEKIIYQRRALVRKNFTI